MAVSGFVIRYSSELTLNLKELPVETCPCLMIFHNYTRAVSSIFAGLDHKGSHIRFKASILTGNRGHSAPVPGKCLSWSYSVSSALSEQCPFSRVLSSASSILENIRVRQDVAAACVGGLFSASCLTSPGLASAPLVAPDCACAQGLIAEPGGVG